jgi:hypothetical protein
MKVIESSIALEMHPEKTILGTPGLDPLPVEIGLATARREQHGETQPWFGAEMHLVVRQGHGGRIPGH